MRISAAARTLSTERAHSRSALRLRCCVASASIRAPPSRCMGLRFPNRVGLAAGFDKNGRYIDALGALGFGFIEVGTVTPRPQPGSRGRVCFASPKRAH